MFFIFGVSQLLQVMYLPTTTQPVMNTLSMLLFEIVCHICAFAAQSYEIYLWQQFKDSPCEQPLARFCAVHGILGMFFNLLNCIFANSRNRYDQTGNTTRRFKVLLTCTIAYSVSVYVWLTFLIANIDFAHHQCPSQMFNFVFFIFVIQSIFFFCASLGFVFWFALSINVRTT